MLLATIRFRILNEYLPNKGGINVEIFNQEVERVQLSLNRIVKIFKNKGLKMPLIFLKKASSLEDLVEIYNFNIDMINTFFIDFENKIDLLDIDVNDLEAEKINFRTTDMKGTVCFTSEDINIELTHEEKTKKYKIKEGDVVETTEKEE